MNNQVSNQTQRRLANDLCLNVLRAMKYRAVIAYSLVSKKALELVQALHLPIKSVRIIMKTDPRIDLEFLNGYLFLQFTMGKNYKQMTSLNDFPVSVNVLKEDIRRKLAVTISNQGMTLGEWIKHICSISNQVKVYEAEFDVETMQLDVQSLRNVFPELRKIGIQGLRNETPEHETLNIQNILRAFLPYVKEVQSFYFPLGENLFFQHIGMANLKNLDFYYPKIFNFDFLFTLNAENCTIVIDKMPLRDLNRFFKLWVKGSNPRLKKLTISCDPPTVPDWNVLLKGLKVEELKEVEGEIEDENEEEDDRVEKEDEVDEEAEEEEEEDDDDKESEGSESEEESGEELDEEEEGGEGKKFFIMNCRGMRGQIEVKYFAATASVTFDVSKINWGDNAFH